MVHMPPCLSSKGLSVHLVVAAVSLLSHNRGLECNRYQWLVFIIWGKKKNGFLLQFCYCLHILTMCHMLHDDIEETTTTTLMCLLCISFHSNVSAWWYFFSPTSLTPAVCISFQLDFVPIKRANWEPTFRCTVGDH